MTTCTNCDKQCSRKINNYCSNRYQFDFQHSSYIDKWKKGLVDGGRGINTRNMAWPVIHYLHAKYSACSICGWAKINPITNRVPVEIDHIDGNSENNLENNFNLVDIIRQANGNPIINIAQKIRKNEQFKEEMVLDKNNNGVVFLKINSETLLLEKYFNSKNFEKNPNFVKVLAWTNKAVDYYNDKIRGIIYGDKLGKLCVGEKMVCNKPITDGKNKVLLNNNDEFEVVSYQLKSENKGLKLSYYSVDIISEGNPYTINVLGEKSEEKYREELFKLKEKATKDTSMNRRNYWIKYYKLLDKYADVKYNYALTVHKSQGSTFDNAIVINCDIIRNTNMNERNKLLYTAVTRAKNKLFLITK